MDAFETIVSEILWTQGYWVQTSVKVDLTKEEKRRIGRPSSPRWELDVVAYKGGSGELLVVECKSYLDSRGVKAAEFEMVGEDSKESRYKLFVDPLLRRTVLERLRLQMIANGSCGQDVAARLALACGKIATAGDREALGRIFAANGWLLFDEYWLKGRLREMAASSYENQVSSVVSKLFERID